jgi:serine/threonine-protein kinase
LFSISRKFPETYLKRNLSTAISICIVHRDLKPANLMICPEPGAGSAAGGAEDLGRQRVKVLDFGMAHFEDPEDSRRLTETGLVFGTLHYMSPEHCRGQDISAASDIYSVGVMLYELLAGEVPFDRKNPVEMMTHHLFVTPPPLDQVGVRRAVAPELAALAMWALAKKPEKRPTAAQFRQALRQALNKTDEVSQVLRSSEERIAVAGLPRADRALTPAKQHVATAPDLGTAVAAGQAPRIILWGFDEEGASTLQAALAVNHLDAVRWPPVELPPATIEAQPVRAILLPDRGHSAERVAGLRRSASGQRVPVLVVQVAQSATIPELIRAGASDVALASTETGDICRKVWRMVRKGR